MASSVCGGILFLVSVRGLLYGKAQALGHSSFNSYSSWALGKSCDTQASLLHSMWDRPRPGIEPMSPALAGEFFPTEPPGKPFPPP